jgi:hypothetical protein
MTFHEKRFFFRGEGDVKESGNASEREKTSLMQSVKAEEEARERNWKTD